jgi:hypothetical protein
MVSKLLGTPFGLSTNFASADEFLSKRIQSKLKYWSITKLSWLGGLWWLIVSFCCHSGILSIFGPKQKKGILKIKRLLANYL